VSWSTRQLALRKAMTERMNAGDVLVVDELKLEAPKTKNFVEVLKNLDLKGTALFVVPSMDNNVKLSSRNLESVEIATADMLNTYQVLRSDKLVFTRGALDKLEARLKD